MSEYLVSMRLSHTGLRDFLDNAGTVEVTITAIHSETPMEADAPKQQKPVRKRTSKINEALLDCLTFGQKNVSELKEALVAAGMSANSLSTGLSALQKTKEVIAVGDGVYALVQQQAA